MDFSADLLQVILGLLRCLFPSGVQNKISLGKSSESFLNTCPIHVHFLWLKSTMSVLLFIDVSHFQVHWKFSVATLCII